MSPEEQLPKPDSKDSQMLRGVYALFAQLGGAIVGIAAVSYVVGRNYLSSYHASVGTSWVVPLYSYDQVTRSGLAVALLVAFVAYAAVVKVLDGTSAERLDKLVLWILLIGIVLYVISLVIPDQYLRPRYAVYLAVISGVAIAVSAGLSIGRLFARLRGSGLRWRTYHHLLVYFIYIYAIVQAPSIIGAAQARLDMELEESGLQYVAKDGATWEPWRLVTIIGDKLLLATLAKERGNRSFKLVPIGEGWRITPPTRK